MKNIQAASYNGERTVYNIKKDFPNIIYHSLILAEWVEIGGKNYDFNAVGLTQSEASARCIRFGGKLFEPRDAKTNKDVFVQAGDTFFFNQIFLKTNSTTHGLRTPRESFFSKISNFWAWADILG